MFDVLGGKSPAAKIFGAPFYLAQNLVRPYICRYRQSRSGHLLAVDIRSWVGLFAHLEWFLEIALHCDRHNLTPCFISTSPQYVDPARGANWFEYFFDNRQLSPEDDERICNGQVPICRIEGIRQLGLPADYDSQLNLEIAAALISKYIGIKKPISEKVDLFVKKHFDGKCVLGVHYRGTDKTAEAPGIPYSEFKQAISEILEQNSDFDCLFVSSDEQEFVDFIESEFADSLSVIYHDDEERATKNVAIHRSKQGDGYKKAEEALLNCLLLSECDALIKNASYLSAWSKLFNLELPVFFLNPPFQDQLWFPERDLTTQPTLR